MLYKQRAYWYRCELRRETASGMIVEKVYREICVTKPLGTLNSLKQAKRMILGEEANLSDWLIEIDLINIVTLDSSDTA